MQENNDARGEHRTMVLADGTQVQVREIQPEDAPALQRLVGRLSDQSIHLRFFGPMDKLSDKQARYFAEVDGKDQYALVALDPQDDGEIVAVVRYTREAGTDRAEYAALVEDVWQGQGIGAALTHRLIDEVRSNRVESFYAPVKAGNKRMLSVLRHLDLPERERVEDGERTVEVGLSYKGSQRMG